ncbi:MAG: hypothetical protein LBI17_00970 [Rickettsiales bacterium]|jgi:hypothetical protein|nr:hypothetical protein [Rickettsiales bacterium]
MTRRLEIKHVVPYEDIKPKGKIFMRPQYNATIRALRKLELKIIGMAAACKALEDEKNVRS